MATGATSTRDQTHRPRFSERGAPHTQVFVTSQEGDVLLERYAPNPKQTVLKLSALTSSERLNVRALLDKYKALDPDGKKYKVPIAADDLTDSSWTLAAPIERIHGHLVKLLKKNQPTIAAVKLSDGTLAEIREPEKGIPAGKAVTTRIPGRGCPPPEFAPREVRANRVMREFLTPTQIADFDHAGAVVVVGGETGHRYRVCHRNSRLLNPELGPTFSLVTNLTTGAGVCCEITDLPPSEELLAIVLALSCREREWVSEVGPHNMGVIPAPFFV